MGPFADHIPLVQSISSELQKAWEILGETVYWEDGTLADPRGDCTGRTGHWHQGVVTARRPPQALSSAVELWGARHEPAVFLQGRASLLHPLQVPSVQVAWNAGVPQSGSLCEHQARHSTWRCVRAVREGDRGSLVADRSGLRLLSSLSRQPCTTPVLTTGGSLPSTHLSLIVLFLGC